MNSQNNNLNEQHKTQNNDQIHEDEKEFLCPKCGCKLDGNEIYCPNCGEFFNKKEQKSIKQSNNLINSFEGFIKQIREKLNNSIHPKRNKIILCVLSSIAIIFVINQMIYYSNPCDDELKDCLSANANLVSSSENVEDIKTIDSEILKFKNKRISDKYLREDVKPLFEACQKELSSIEDEDNLEDNNDYLKSKRDKYLTYMQLDDLNYVHLTTTQQEKLANYFIAYDTTKNFPNRNVIYRESGKGHIDFDVINNTPYTVRRSYVEVDLKIGGEYYSDYGYANDINSGLRDSVTMDLYGRYDEIPSGDISNVSILVEADLETY